MNWQEDATYINYAKAIIFLERQTDINIAVGRKYSTGVFGMTFNDPEELIEDNFLFEANICSFEDIVNDFNNLIEDELEGGKDVSMLKKQKDNFIATQDPNLFYICNNLVEGSFTKLSSDDINTMYVDNFLSESMNGHSFLGEIKEAIEELKRQLTTNAGLKKNLWEVVDWCYKKNKRSWDNFSNSTIYDLLAPIIGNEKTQKLLNYETVIERHKTDEKCFRVGEIEIGDDINELYSEYFIQFKINNDLSIEPTLIGADVEDRLEFYKEELNKFLNKNKDI